MTRSDEHAQPRWRIAAERLTRICRTEMGPGEHLPPVKQLARRLGVSASMVSSHVVPELARRGELVQDEDGWRTPAGASEARAPRAARPLREVAAERLTAFVQTLRRGEPLPPLGELALKAGASTATVQQSVMPALIRAGVVERRSNRWYRPTSAGPPAPADAAPPPAARRRSQAPAHAKWPAALEQLLQHVRGLDPGVALEPATVLAAELGMHHVTVNRQVLSRLAAEGWIVKPPGRARWVRSGTPQGGSQ